MFMGVTFVHLNEDGSIKDQLKSVVNSNCIKMIVENPKVKDTCMISFTDDMPSGLIKGSYEDNAKILFGFNRKM